MSSKGRGSIVEPNEHYATPQWCVHRLLDRIGIQLGLIPHSIEPVLLEPCIGSGAIVDAVDSWQDLRCPDKTPRARWIGYDIDPGSVLISNDRVQVTIASFPETFAEGADPIEPVKASITNPPFSLALEMAQAAMLVAPIVVQLSRVGWLGSAQRSDWLRSYTPSVYLLPDRPSFVGKGSTDSDYYSWNVWGLWDRPCFEILDSTPLQERKAEYEKTGEIRKHDPGTNVRGTGATGTETGSIDCDRFHEDADRPIGNN